MNTICIYKRIKENKKQNKQNNENKEKLRNKVRESFWRRKTKESWVSEKLFLTHKKCFGGFYKVVGNWGFQKYFNMKEIIFRLGQIWT